MVCAANVWRGARSRVRARARCVRVERFEVRLGGSAGLSFVSTSPPTEPPTRHAVNIILAACELVVDGEQGAPNATYQGAK